MKRLDANVKQRLRNFINTTVLPVIDIVGIPFSIIAAFMMRMYKTTEHTKKMRMTKKIFLRFGVWPLLDHYYEPLFNVKYLRHSLRDIRNLPGFDMNEDKQISLLESFDYSEELRQFPVESPGKEGVFYYKNLSFGTGDSEILYSMVRKFKPKKIIEIGSGFSTLMAKEAIQKNRIESEGQYECEHICIEPYERPWLENVGVTLIRKKLEDVEKEIFKRLEAGDILFIDSSHIIRPQGDVLMEYLEILPLINSGVLVHVHDIFTPRDYMDEWLYDRMRFWNEQYLLEAFLTCNDNYRVLLAVNYMFHKNYGLMSKRCPMLDEKREPGSFWMQKL